MKIRKDKKEKEQFAISLGGGVMAKKGGEAYVLFPQLYSGTREQVVNCVMGWLNAEFDKHDRPIMHATWTSFTGGQNS